MWKVIIIWDDGKTEIEFTSDFQKAQDIVRGYRMVFGNQIQYAAIDRASRISIKSEWEVEVDGRRNDQV